jgi:hypothetical protein
MATTGFLGSWKNYSRTESSMEFDSSFPITARCTKTTRNSFTMLKGAAVSSDAACLGHEKFVAMVETYKHWTNRQYGCLQGQ